MPEPTLPLPEIPQKPASGRLLFYCVGFALFQAASLVCILLLSLTPWFLTHDSYPGIYLQGYATRLKHEDCDVVLYGDSTALTGLDPGIVQQITGLKTCNIADTISSHMMVGSRFPLDTYLANNKRPRFILAMYNPLNFNPDWQPFSSYYADGVLYGLHYNGSRAFYRGLLYHHFQWVAHYTFWAGTALIGDLVDRVLPGSRPPDYSGRAERTSRRGIWTYPLPPQTTCLTQPARPPTLGDVRIYPDSIAAFRKRYAVDGTQVMVNIAPMPACVATRDLVRINTVGLHDNAFETLPISYFNEGDSHYSPAGSSHVSIAAANQILALEKQPAGIAPAKEPQ